MRLVRLAWLYACLVLFASMPLLAAAPAAEAADTVREKIISQLGLTDVQKAAIEASRAKREKTLGELFAKIEALRLRIQDEFKKPVFEKERVKELHRETKELTNRIMDIHFESLVEIRELLEPVQHAKMIELFNTIGKDLPSPAFPEPAPAMQDVGSASADAPRDTGAERGK